MKTPYEEAKEQRDILQSTVNNADKVINSFPRSSEGLVSNEVMASPEYRQARAHFQNAFSRLQKFNQAFVKTFKKEIRNRRG